MITNPKAIKFFGGTLALLIVFCATAAARAAWYDFSLKTGPSVTEELINETPVASEDEVKKAFFAILKAYINEDQGTFMGFIADDFQGNRSALEDAIDDDFRFFNNITISPTISRIVQAGDSFEVDFVFYRKLQSAKTGSVVSDNASSYMLFKRTDDGCKVIAMASPLIFGLSNAEEVATNVDSGAVGKEIIVVDSNTGSVTKAEQQTTVAETASGNVRTGTESMHSNLIFTGPDSGVGECFIFSSQSITTDSSEQIEHRAHTGDFSLFRSPNAGDPIYFSTANGAMLKDLGSGSLDSVTSVPADSSAYTYAIPLSGPHVIPESGRLYAFKTSAGYSVIRITSLSASVTSPISSVVDVTFDYKIQMNGTNNF